MTHRPTNNKKWKWCKVWIGPSGVYKHLVARNPQDISRAKCYFHGLSNIWKQSDAREREEDIEREREGEKKSSDLAYLCHWSGMYLFSFLGRNDHGNAPLTMMKLHMLVFVVVATLKFKPFGCVCVVFCPAPNWPLRFSEWWLSATNWKQQPTNLWV